MLDPEIARVATLSGAQFVVSPTLNPETARLCNRYQVPYIPASTLKEVIEGMECGADIVKVFPPESLGPAFVMAVRGPLPKASLMPTGGVSLERVGEWTQAGCVAWCGRKSNGWSKDGRLKIHHRDVAPVCAGIRCA